MIGISLDLGRPEKGWRLFMFFIMNNMRSMFAINEFSMGGILHWHSLSRSYLRGEIQMDPGPGILAMCWASLVHMEQGHIWIHRCTADFLFSNQALRISCCGYGLWTGTAHHYGRIHIPFC